MIRRIGITAIAIAILIGGGVKNITYAIEPQNTEFLSIESQIIMPMWDNIRSITPSISAQGKTLYPKVIIKAKNSTASISGVMYLQRYSSGKWLDVSSWRFSETSNVILSKTYTGISGATYRTKVVVNVDGETTEATSSGLKI